MTRLYQGLSSLAPGVKMRDPGNELADKQQRNTYEKEKKQVKTTTKTKSHSKTILFSEDIKIKNINNKKKKLPQEKELSLK